MSVDTAPLLSRFRRFGAKIEASTGTAIAVGPVFEGEGAWGMAVVEVGDAEAARSLADADPVILADIGFRFDIAPMPTLILRSYHAGSATEFNHSTFQDLNNGY